LYTRFNRPIGLTGTQGLIGLTGEIGTQGSIGLTGPIGLTGEIGTQGSIGLTGPIGLTGEIGTQGSIGLTGTMGSNITDNNFVWGIKTNTQVIIGAGVFNNIIFTIKSFFTNTGFNAKLLL